MSIHQSRNSTRREPEISCDHALEEGYVFSGYRADAGWGEGAVFKFVSLRGYDGGSRRYQA